MRREITIKEIIEELKHLPQEAKITIDTKLDVHVVGFVVAKEDGNRQIAEIQIPKTKQQQ